MSFVSLNFAAFFAAVLLGLALMPTRAAKHALLLVANVVFYGFKTPWFLAVLAVPSLVDFACALRIERATDARERRSWLVLSLVCNLGILFYYKYSNFFGDIVATATGAPHLLIYVALPVGISFFTFKTMSYTIDVYRGQLPACRSLWRYAMFVSFFPELVAGPIVRASVFLPQMDRAMRLSWARVGSGLQIALLGLTKKLLVADRLSIFVDPVFASPATYSQGTILTAIVAYSLQIYCDFSGYSDMAVGIARVIGFDLPENFNMPYASTSITEFWRRWHITLSQWLRDYLYIPLGGSRRGPLRTYVNLMLTMLLGGLWHGASWTFVIWGALHGVGLAVHKLWISMGSDSIESNNQWSLTPLKSLKAVAGWAATYAFVCLGWVFFRCATFDDAALVLRKAVGLTPGGVSWLYAPTFLFAAIAAAAHVLGSARAQRQTADGHVAADSYPVLRSVGFASAFVITAWLVILLLFVPQHRSPFIYFQF